LRLTLGQFLPGESVVHLLDPRVKLLITTLGIGTAFFVDNIGILATFSLLCIGLTFVAGLPFIRLVKGLKPFLWLFLFTAILHVFMTPGDKIAWIPCATRQGLTSGMYVGLRLVCAIWISTIFTLTTSPSEMVRAMTWFMKPLKYVKVPVGEIALAVMLAIRFIPVLFEEADRTLKAQKARGVDLESGGLMKRIRSIIPIIIPLLRGVFRRTEDLAVALAIKGYRPGQERTSMKERKLNYMDLLALVISSFVLCFFLYL